MELYKPIKLMDNFMVDYYFVISKCDGKVWCVDVGMSCGVLCSRPEVKSSR
jgi:hypothetical protein